MTPAARISDLYGVTTADADSLLALADEPAVVAALENARRGVALDPVAEARTQLAWAKRAEGETA